jgi:alkylhydroperoxidase family enzyme
LYRTILWDRPLVVKVLRQLLVFLRVLPSGRRNRADLLGWLIRRPQVLVATAGYELALVASARCDSRLKMLAGMKAAALVNCEYCLDIGSALCLQSGISEDQLRELPDYLASELFDDDEKLVMELAEAMTRQPAGVSTDLRQRVSDRFAPSELTELAASVAWVNYRGRLNQALGVRSSGFSEGAACAIPER